MSRTIGRAFPIRERDVRSYDAVRPSRKLRPNPIGVHTIATINGRGAYASARAASSGRSRAQRMARARSLMRGTAMANRSHRASFVSAMKSNRGRKGRKRRGGRASQGRKLARYSRMVARYRKAGRTKTEARRLAKKKVFGGRGRRRSSAPRRGRKRARRRNYRQNRKAARKGSPELQAARAQVREAQKRAREVAKSARRSAAKARREAKKQARAAKREAAKKVREARKAAKARRKRPAALRKVKRKYRRVSLRDPSTGRMRKSYMYRDRKGRLRKIPFWVIAGGANKREVVQAKGPEFDKAMARIRKQREAAAKRMLTRGSAFVPNRKRRKRRGKKRSAMARRRKRSGKRRSKRRRKGRRKGGRRRRKGGKRAARKKFARYSRMVAKYRRKGYSTAKARRLAKKKVYGKATRRRRKGGRRRRKGGRRRRRAKRNATPNRGYTENRRRRNRRRSNRGYTPNRRRRNRRRRNAFMADLKTVFKTGALVTAGFLIHRLLTSLANDYIFSMLVAPKNAEAPTQGQATLAAWGKPIMGGVVAVAGYALVGAAFPKARAEIGAGMVASFLQSVVMSVLVTANQPRIAEQFAGVPDQSMAYRLRGVGRYRRRRGMRGLGAYRSIAPTYIPVGQYTQAAAGQYVQAAAGGMGEYFTPNAVGEYFIPPEQLQGVGQYEQAGPLAMQASAGVGQVIEDGIRPDADLDRVLTLAESAAGVGAARMRNRRRRGMRGMGEYYTATRSNSDWQDTTVGTQDQWIPNGPLWAGALSVKDTQGESELPAGILAGPGGNGVLSG